MLLQVENERINESSMSGDYRAFCEFELKHLLKTQDIFTKRIVARLRFQKFIATEIYINRKVKEYIGNKKTLFFVGDYKIPAISIIRKYVRSPTRRFIETIKRMEICDVIRVNEFRTTMICCNCFTKLSTSTTPHRFQVS